MTTSSDPTSYYSISFIETISFIEPIKPPSFPHKTTIAMFGQIRDSVNPKGLRGSASIKEVQRAGDPIAYRQTVLDDQTVPVFDLAEHFGDLK